MKYNKVLDDTQMSDQEPNGSSVAVGILDCCRKCVDRCLAGGRNKFAPLKLANEILNLMHEIGLSLSLEKNDYASLFKWTQTQFSGEKIGEYDFFSSFYAKA